MFGEDAPQDVWPDFQPTGHVVDPAYYIHVIEKKLKKNEVKIQASCSHDRARDVYFKSTTK